MSRKRMFVFIVLDLLWTSIMILALINLHYSPSKDSIPFVITSILWLFFWIVGELLVFIEQKKNNEYFVCYNHEFYIDLGTNIFANAILKKTIKLKIVNKNLKDRFLKKEKYVYFNSELNINFIVYELKDNLQLIVLNKRELYKYHHHHMDYSDLQRNRENIIKNLGIKDFNDKYNGKCYYYNGKRTLIYLYKKDDLYHITEYEYTTSYCDNINNALELLLPHWVAMHECAYPVFKTLESAQAYIDYNFAPMLDANIYSSMHYFIVEDMRQGTCYHEFQTGNKKDVFWDRTSLLLSDDLMEKTGLYKFLEKNVPHYNYYGPSVISKETWELLKKYSRSESKIIQDIIKEMLPWAERSIEVYGCFTIYGI
ncbi:MAG: hypothetical protein HUJ61_06770 [Bacilli bacterium]|nr:hypothetical protein [Bacilli bacterium]